MPSVTLLTPLRRDVVLAIVAVCLLFTPMWVSVTGIADRTHTYERVEVVGTDDGTLAYASGSAPPFTAISEEVACSRGLESIRAC